MNTTTRRPSPPGVYEPADTGGPDGPAPHTDAELGALADLLPRDPEVRVKTVTVGRGRDTAFRAADAFTDARQTRGGTVLAVVDRPEAAASRLRPATRPAAGPPDAWVVAAALPGFVRPGRGLRRSTDRDPVRTYAFAPLQDPRLPVLTSPDTAHGLRDATAAGGTRDVRHRRVASYEEGAPVP